MTLSIPEYMLVCLCPTHLGTAHIWDGIILGYGAVLSIVSSVPDLIYQMPVAAPTPTPNDHQKNVLRHCHYPLTGKITLK